MKKILHNVLLSIKKKQLLLVFIALLIIIFFPLAKCETLTLIYGNQFEGLELKTNMLIKSDYYKVLKYSDSEAEIYYVLKNGYGNVIEFYKVDDKWEISNWFTVWSSSGSASGVIWPYWWHFIYGGL